MLKTNLKHRRSRAIQRIAALALAVAVAVCGLPQPAWQALGAAVGAVLPDAAGLVAAELGGGGVAYAAPGDIALSKDAHWVEIPGRDDPTAQVTLSVSGEPAAPSSDVIIMLDRTPGMYMSWCINQDHYHEDVVVREVAYDVQIPNNSSWFRVSDWITIRMSVHEIVYDGSLRRTLAGFGLSNYRTEYNGAPIVAYRAASGGSSWTLNEWEAAESIAAVNLRAYIIGLIGNNQYLTDNYPYLLNLPQRISKPDRIPSAGCENPFEAGFSAAKELAKSLNAGSGGSGTDNRVALWTFGSGRQTNDRYLSLLAGFESSAAQWDSLNAVNYLSQGTNDSRYRIALEAAKYYLNKVGGYPLLDPVTKAEITLPAYDMNSVSFDNALVNNTGGLQTDLDRGVLGPARDRGLPAPYIMIISSLVDIKNLLNPNDVDYTGLTVNTGGIVLHGVGFAANSDVEYADNIKRITAGEATDGAGAPLADKYLGHYDLQTDSYNSTYKGSYYQILTGSDLTETFNQLTKVVRAAGYEAVITDVIRDGFVLDESQPVLPAGSDYSYDAATNTITWRLDVITQGGSSLSYTIKAVSSGLDPLNPAKIITADDPDPNSVWTNESAVIDYKDSHYVNKSGTFGKPKLQVQRIAYRVEYYLSDDYSKPVDAVTVVGYNSPLNPYLPLNKSLVNENKYPGYDFVRDASVKIPLYMGNGDVLQLYYAKTPPDPIKYTIEFYYNNSPLPGKSIDVVAPAVNGGDSVPVDMSLIPDTSNGMPRLTDIGSIPVYAKDGDVIRVYYATNPNNYITLTYKINYIIRGQAPFDVITISARLPAGQTFTNLRSEYIKAEIEQAGKLYLLDTNRAAQPPTSSKALDAPPQAVTQNEEINLYYIPAEKLANYKVEYYIDNVLAETHTEFVKIAGDSTLIPVNLLFVSEKYVGNKFPGFRWAASNPVFNEGDTVPEKGGDGSAYAIKLYYTTDTTLRKTFYYQIEYYKVGGAGDNADRPAEVLELSVDTWAGIGSYEVDSAYTPLTREKWPDYTLKSVIPGNRLVENGGALKVYYWYNGGIQSQIEYYVDYLRQDESGAYPAGLKETAGPLYAAANANGIAPVDPAYITGTAIELKYYPGYRLNKSQVIQTMVTAGNNRVEVKYDIDYSMTFKVAYKVRYYLTGEGGDTWLYDTVDVERDVWAGYFSYNQQYYPTSLFVAYDKTLSAPDLFSDVNNEGPYDFQHIIYKGDTIGDNADMPDYVYDGDIISVYYKKADKVKIGYTIEYYKDGALDPDETVKLERYVNASATGVNGFNWLPADPERLMYTSGRHFNGFSYVVNGTKYVYPGAAEAGVADSVNLYVRDGTVIKVNFTRNFSDAYDVDIYKDVFNEFGDLISKTAQIDAAAANKVFRVVVHGNKPDAQGSYYRQNVYVSMAQSPFRLQVPMGDTYTITEVTTNFVQDGYILLDILTSGNRRDGVLDLRDAPAGTVGNVSVLNKRDQGLIPPPQAGVIKVSKFIYSNGKRVTDPSRQNFAVNLYQGATAGAAGTQIGNTQYISDGTPTSFSAVVTPGTYTVEEYVPTGVPYAFVGIYDADLAREGQPTGNALTFDLGLGKGKAVIVINQIGATPPPPPVDLAALTIQKILVQRDGKAIFNDDKRFGIQVTGDPNSVAKDFSGFVSLLNGESQTIAVPRGSFTISEIPLYPPERYSLEAVITSDTRLSNNAIIDTDRIDMTIRPEGYATVFNTRFDTPDAEPGKINITKYVFDSKGELIAPEIIALEAAPAFTVNVSNSNTGPQQVTNWHTATFNASSGDGLYTASEPGLPDGYIRIGFVDARGYTGLQTPTETKTVNIKADDEVLKGASLLLFNRQENKAYTVTYNAGSGTGAPVDDKTYGPGYTVTVLDGVPTWPGHAFTGWLYNGKPYNAGDTFKMPDENVELVAQWDFVDYTVTYDANGGSGAPTDSGTYHVGDPVTVLGGIPTWTGHDFKGWLYDGNVYAGGGTFTMPAADVTLVAQWDFVNYNTTYDPNGGSGAPVDNTPHHAGDTVTVLDGTPTWPGRTFKGWLFDGDLYHGGDTFTMPAADATLVAQWDYIDYSVTYDPNGGSGAPADNNKYHVDDPVTVLNGIPTWTGHEFKGWLYSGNLYAGGGTFTMPAADVTLVAQWDNVNYNTTYDPNGGSGAPVDNTPHHAGDTVTVLDGTPTWPGRTFKGWLFDGDLYHGGDTFTMPAADATLVAQWDYIDYTVTYDPNGGSGAPADNNKYHVGDPVTVLSGIPTWTGHDFKGWLYSGNLYSGGGTFTMPAADVTLVAQWDNVNFTVTYDPNGGSGAPVDNAPHHAGDTVTVLSGIPTWPGHNFSGWVYSGTVYNGGTSFIMPAANVTFVAQWDNINYTVTYDPNGGSGAPTDGSPHHVGDRVTVLSGLPTWPGHDFKGWLYGGAVYNGGDTFTMPAANVTLVAQWDNTPPPEKVTLILHKLLFDEETQDLLANDPTEFAVAISSNGVTVETVTLKGGEYKQVELDRGIYTIYEIPPAPGSKYAYITTDSFPLVNNNNANVIDLRTADKGGATVFNMLKSDETPPDPPVGKGNILITKQVLRGGEPLAPDADIEFEIDISGTTKIVPQGQSISVEFPYGTYIVSENPPQDGYTGHRIIDMYNQNAAQLSAYTLTLSENNRQAWLMVVNEAEPLEETTVNYSVEYYLNGQPDYSAWQKLSGVTGEPDGLLAINPATYVVENKYSPYYALDKTEYVAPGAATQNSIPTKIMDGSVIKVYYKPNAIQNAVKINLYKLLVDDNGRRITAANDNTVFSVVIDGGATAQGGNGYKAIVPLANAQQKTVDVPRGNYTISEQIVAGAPLYGRYFLREIVTSGNLVNGALNMNTRTTGNATLINVRIADGNKDDGGDDGKTNKDPDIKTGNILVTKYVFNDGVEMANATGTFQAVLNGRTSGGANVTNQTLNMVPASVNTPFTPGPGTYTVTENLSQAPNYTLIGIYDGNVGKLGAATSATVTLEADKPGASVVILNAYVPAAPGPSPSPGGGGGGGGGGIPPSPRPVVPPAASPRPSPTAIISETTPPLAGFIADHIQYINGYPDGSVRPDANITRAETSAILYRLLSDPKKYNKYTSTFPDVPEDEWYSQSVKYLTSVGIIKGYPEGDFRPDNPITRAEFATLISGFDKLAQSRTNKFSDIEGHWAVGYINSAAEKGWVTGYPDGTFMPEANLTRAEIVTVINRMLLRAIEVQDIPRWAPTYNDINDGHWGYTAIIEASVGHEFERKADSIFEKWTRRLAWSPVLES